MKPGEEAPFEEGVSSPGPLLSRQEFLRLLSLPEC